jgi:Lar family restriction alleviation protein
MSDQETELKPCPFCGLSEVGHDKNSLNDHWVFCDFCEATGPIRDTEAEAAAAWNASAWNAAMDWRAADFILRWAEGEFNQATTAPLRQRYDAGERSRELYTAIVSLGDNYCRRPDKFGPA